MSIRHNGKIIAGATQYHPNLFDWKWADHQLDDVQWLRADTFSWQSGAVYESAYQHLVDDIDGQTTISETVAGITISFYLANDGHKITTDESAVTQIYAATGVAWYYVLDTTNQRFKLPRTKFGFTGIRSGVGGFVDAGLPNITGSSYGYVSSANRGASGALQMSGGSDKDATSGGGWWVEGVTVSVNASNSSSIYGNSNTVQPKATEMYLYFYVGNFTQTALENTAGVTTEVLNDKADLDFSNTTMIDYVVEKQEPTSSNNNTWYRKYASGWVEQGGLYTNPSATSSGYTQNLPIAMSDTNYHVMVSIFTSTPSTNYYAPKSSGRTTTSFVITPNESQVMWQVSGVAA